MGVAWRQTLQLGDFQVQKISTWALGMGFGHPGPLQPSAPSCGGHMCTLWLTVLLEENLQTSQLLVASPGV